MPQCADERAHLQVALEQEHAGQHGEDATDRRHGTGLGFGEIPDRNTRDAARGSQMLAGILLSVKRSALSAIAWMYVRHSPKVVGLQRVAAIVAPGRPR